jgi:hypothetical protein
MDGLELSTDKLDLAAPDRCDLTLSDFHEISRAAAALRDRWNEKAGLPRDAIRSQCSTCSKHKEKETGNAED